MRTDYTFGWGRGSLGFLTCMELEGGCEIWLREKAADIANALIFHKLANEVLPF
jgi:hypothetical protein